MSLSHYSPAELLNLLKTASPAVKNLILALLYSKGILV